MSEVVRHVTDAHVRADWEATFGKSDETMEAANQQAARLARAIVRYSDEHIRPGSYVCACLANDLHAAAIAADPMTWALTKGVMEAIRESVPREARGSYAAIDAWCATREKGGAA